MMVISIVCVSRVRVDFGVVLSGVVGGVEEGEVDGGGVGFDFEDAEQGLSEKGVVTH